MENTVYSQRQKPPHIKSMEAAIYKLQNQRKMKTVTHLDADRFWVYLDREHPEIGSQMQTRAFFPADGAIVSFKPARMTTEDYDKYVDILQGWLIENGFAGEGEGAVYK
jgi:hypothetical protein